jgi:hypothetical protein
MTTRFLLKRAIAIGLVVLLIAAAGLCYLRRAKGSPDLQDWLRFGYMAALNADLSKPGEYSVSFEADEIDPVLALEVPKDFGSRVSAEELLAGLQATTELIDSRGEMMYAGRIPTEAPRFAPPSSGRISLVEYGYIGIEQNRIKVTISQPALALKGVPHRLIVVGHGRNASVRFGNTALAFVGHATLLAAAVILTAVVITSRHKPNSPDSKQGKVE